MKKRELKEFARDIGKMIDTKLKDFEVKMNEKIEKIKNVPEQTAPQIDNQITQREQITATFKGGKQETKSILLIELHRLMLKHGITEIINAKRSMMENIK